ncbi:MAG TPA: type II secretion system F family protein [Hyphomonadaceae bacterium]|jgi:tight adherence protein C|nr:type II secretion system F family protein [Hyphomonadaceae bacterium]
MQQYTPIIIALLFGGAAIAFIWFGISDQFHEGARVARRLFGETRKVVGVASQRVERLVNDDNLLRSFEKFLTPDNESRTNKIRMKLLLSGYRNPSAVRVYFAVKWSIAIAGFTLAAIVFILTMNPQQPVVPTISALMVIMLAFFATDMWIERKISYRRLAVERAFPDALDLLLVCVEAGHGMDQAFGRVAQEIHSAAPILAADMKLVVSQLRAGRDRERVMADFAWRTGLPDVASFVTTLRQADQFGVSVAEALRVYAAEMRNKRFMRAEEKANMMPVKLALGAILFTVPPTMLILVGPSVVQIVREMGKAAGG